MATPLTVDIPPRDHNANAASAALFQRALAVMPGGSTRSTLFTPPFPPYAASGRGAQVTDADGRTYLDFANNFFSLVHGHAHPAIVEALIAQVTRGTAFGLPTESEILLAEAITARSPALQQIRFANSGTEAVMNAIKAARAFTGRSRIAKLEGSYHGSYDHTEVSLDSGPDNWGTTTPEPIAYVPGTPRGVLEDTLILPLEDIDRTEMLLEAHGDTLAAVLLDPLPSRAGMIPVPPEYARRLDAAIRRTGTLLIVDEVVSFRLSWSGAHGMLGLQPDLVALGKIIGGGLPVGAIAGRQDVMAVFDSRPGKAKVPQGGTFSANPLTMAAGLASMRLLTPAAYEHLNRLGERLREGARAIFAAAAQPAQITGQGSLFRIHMTDRPITGYRSAYAKPDEARRLSALRAHLLDQGFLVTPAVSGALSTVMTDADIDAFLDALAGFMQAGR